MVEADETEIALSVPDDAAATLLDLYGWDGASWVFVPSKFDRDTNERYAANQELFDAIALVQVAAPDEMTVGGIWSDAVDSEQLTKSIALFSTFCSRLLSQALSSRNRSRFPKPHCQGELSD